MEATRKTIRDEIEKRVLTDEKGKKAVRGRERKKKVDHRDEVRPTVCYSSCTDFVIEKGIIGGVKKNQRTRTRQKDLIPHACTPTLLEWTGLKACY